MASQPFKYSVSASLATSLASPPALGGAVHDSSLQDNQWADSVEMGTQVDPSLMDNEEDTSVPAAAFVTAKMVLNSSNAHALPSAMTLPSTPITPSATMPTATPPNGSATAYASQASVSMTQFIRTTNAQVRAVRECATDETSARPSSPSPTLAKISARSAPDHLDTFTACTPTAVVTSGSQASISLSQFVNETRGTSSKGTP